MRLPVFAFTLLASSANAQDLVVQFSDGAPKDSITVTNSGCPLANAMLVLDLGPSKGGLVFDVADQGAGVEVFQPVEIAYGYAALSPVRDGDQRLQIFVESLAAGAKLGLTADLDDTLDVGQQITVSGSEMGSEMAGASITLALADRVLTSTFGTDGIAHLDLPDDASACLPS